MSWAITNLEVRRLSHEAEAKLTIGSDLAMLTEDTYVRYTCYEYYKQGDQHLLKAAAAFDTSTVFVVGNIVYHEGAFFEATEQIQASTSIPVTGCSNNPVFSATETPSGVVFSADIRDVTDPNADVFIYTRENETDQWALWLGSGVPFKGQVRFEVIYHNGCPATIARYDFNTLGELSLIVSNQGTATNPLIQGEAHIPMVSPVWKPILFDTNTEEGRAYQEVYDIAMGPITAYRVLRDALPKAKAPIQGGQFKGSGSALDAAPTRHDYTIRVDSIDQKVNRYVARLSRYAKANELTSWGSCEIDKDNCSSNTKTLHRFPLNIL